MSLTNLALANKVFADNMRMKGTVEVPAKECKELADKSNYRVQVCNEDFSSRSLEERSERKGQGRLA
ncbi:hypothetical protein GLAREA_08200 [Glarea lozoyensis ATCC 20868]|uniref:Uncharacterized protein n=1 Tax=Glarea lozoyensis (strain ATCC 20868 / MF5171) TaxID=1116229 RepID=S3DCF7_GLAL2|nr:uncharacterized protein GLAREA_08200 [Glarea lozoyensis ATCC 20868]EPE24348.1 hypothetical protein GLAREA_08200 [Glarea lozoyensis ATCC 20868]